MHRKIIIAWILLATSTIAEANPLRKNDISREAHDNSTNDYGLPLKMWSRKRRYNRVGSTRHLHPTFNHTAPDKFLLDSSRHDESDTDIFDVVIIGAGWSGVTAAISLESKGVRNYKILEARDRIGGRSRTVTDSWENVDIAMDLGSSFLIGSEGNPIFDILQQENLTYSISRGRQLFYQQRNKGPFDRSYIWSLYTELIDEGFYPYQRQKMMNSNYDTSLRNIVNQYATHANLNAFKKSVLDMFLATTITQDLAASLNKLSLWFWDSGKIFRGDDFFLNEGYTPLFEANAAKIHSKIETQAVVEKINYRRSQTKVSYLDADGVKQVIKAKKVLVTVPLGVLKARTIQFQPKLPKGHKKAFSQVGMGLLNKIFMFWNTADVFWPTKTEWLTEITRRQTQFEFYNPHSLNNGRPFLIGIVAGNEAKYVEEQFGDNNAEYESEMLQRAMLHLRNMFGQNITNPAKVYVTKWGLDPFSRGSYSYNKVGVKKIARAEMRKPVKDRIYFAGEATSSNYYGTTHGAYLSGETAAQKMMA